MRNRETESVVTALGELRDIDAERTAEQREAEERRQAAQAAIERARAEEAAQRQRAERARAEKARLDVEIAERRAAIEAQMKIEQRRIAIEAEVSALRERQGPAGRYWLTVALLALVVAGQAALLYGQHAREQELHQLIEQYETEARARHAVPGLPADLTPDPRADPTPLPPDVARAVEPPPTPAATKPRPRPRPAQPHEHPNSRPAVADDCDPNDPLGCLPKSQSNR